LTVVIRWTRRLKLHGNQALVHVVGDKIKSILEEGPEETRRMVLALATDPDIGLLNAQEDEVTDESESDEEEKVEEEKAPEVDVVQLFRECLKILQLAKKAMHLDDQLAEKLKTCEDTKRQECASLLLASGIEFHEKAKIYAAFVNMVRCRTNASLAEDEKTFYEHFDEQLREEIEMSIEYRSSELIDWTRITNMGTFLAALFNNDMIKQKTMTSFLSEILSHSQHPAANEALLAIFPHARERMRDRQPQTYIACENAITYWKTIEASYSCPPHCTAFVESYFEDAVMNHHKAEFCARTFVYIETTWPESSQSSLALLIRQLTEKLNGDCCLHEEHGVINFIGKLYIYDVIDDELFRRFAQHDRIRRNSENFELLIALVKEKILESNKKPFLRELRSDNKEQQQQPSSSSSSGAVSKM